jgi:Protein of unknown function (DUF3800)
MSRPRCDPIDIAATLAALSTKGCGLTGGSRDAGVLRRLYADYASVAARPYARASWEKALRAAERGVKKPAEIRSHMNSLHVNDRSLALDRELIKPGLVLTLSSDAPKLYVRGDALNCQDDKLILKYERRSSKPNTIVLAGWGGQITVGAMRFCSDYGIAILVLEWDRSLMSVVACPASRAHTRLLMVFQAFIDDSSTPGRVFVLAGHVASADTWAKFSKDWEQMLPYGTLNKDGRYHFKMSEMATNPERMARVQAFYRIIGDHDLTAISCAIDERDLRNAVSRIWSLNRFINVGVFMDTFFFVFRALVDHIHEHRNLLPMLREEKIDLIFDNQSQKNKIIGAWDLFVSSRHPSIQSRFGATPRFEDDNDFLPLQAADLWAWWVREWYERGKPMDGGTMYLPPLSSDNLKKAIVIKFDADSIVENIVNIIKSSHPDTIIYDGSYRGASWS